MALAGASACASETPAVLSLRATVRRSKVIVASLYMVATNHSIMRGSRPTPIPLHRQSASADGAPGAAPPLHRL
jgi:hypothetical protein